ncbi:hypothetical protein [Streptomyces sp. NPDC101234]|uniref:hypothetical protein n=1 Tax=Streptomyces sp. NPDC101234 TaxID=3366138 RepID=UPI00381F3BD1
MRLVSDPGYGEVDLSASAEELTWLASAVAQGQGLLSRPPSPGGNALTGVEVKGTSGPGVLVRLDVERQIARSGAYCSSATRLSPWRRPNRPCAPGR